MTKKEKEYWENFKKKYGERFKRVSAVTSSGIYVEAKPSEIAIFENADKAFILGDLAEYIYDLEDIKEESLIVFKKYNKLLKQYKELKDKKGE